jgi:two-component system, chemotaxis family, sensor kinase Cph1
LNQVTEFFSGIFSTDKWPARWHCGEWSSFHGWLYIASDLMIWLAYFLIPIIILRYFAGRQKVIQYRSVYILFAAFILLCGSTHFMDAVMFWLPAYRLNALLRFVTGVVSLITAYKLFQLLPRIFQQKTNMELEAEIEKRRLVEAKLEEAYANLEAFTYVASHDLQEPLRKIRIFTSMLIENNAGKFDEADVKLSEKIVGSSLRMQTIIQDVLTLSTLSVNPKLDKVNLNDAVAIALEDMEMKILDKKASVEVGPLPQVNGNKEYLAQLFVNLISNALKFSNRVPAIQITGEVTGEGIFIYVKDNGIGINPEYSEKVFIAFERQHPKSAYEGSGIGLAICKRIVELHGGSITVNSTENVGSTFVIRLPLVPAQVQ